MARYLEKETEAEVEINILPPFRGGEPFAEVIYPNGRRYGFTVERIAEFFDIVTPQIVPISAHMGLEYER
ncbi:MAG TPA: hypothetical protein VLV86_18205 [Vicinamibacterales bacterium]|nr:hypothetical protein [Vicinamibacterales bacterium]